MYSVNYRSGATDKVIESVHTGTYEECFAFMLNQAEQGEHTEGFYTLDKKECRL